MKSSSSSSSSARTVGRGLVSTVALVIGVAMTVGGGGVAQAAVVPTVGLGTAGTFGVLGGSTVTNTGTSTINGLNVGVSPGTAITGFPPGLITKPGTKHQADAVAGNAQNAALTAFNDAAGRATAPADRGLTDLVGKTLQPGVYQGNLSLTGTLTLDNRTDPDAVFIFQASSTLITASGSVVKFTTAHASCNVFWQVRSSATLGTGTRFVGTVLAHSSITAQTGATVTGRLLAATAAVNLDTNVITAPTCATAPPTTTSSTPPSTPPTSTGGGGGTGTVTSRPGTSIPPPGDTTTASTIPLTTPTITTSATTGSSVSTTRRTATTSIATTTTAAAVITTSTVETTVLTQPSFPTGVPGGQGPAAPLPLTAVIGALLILVGGLCVLWRIPAMRRTLRTANAASWTQRNRTGEHR